MQDSICSYCLDIDVCGLGITEAIHDCVLEWCMCKECMEERDERIRKKKIVDEIQRYDEVMEGRWGFI